MRADQVCYYSRAAFAIGTQIRWLDFNDCEELISSALPTGAGS